MGGKEFDGLGGADVFIKWLQDFEALMKDCNFPVDKWYFYALGCLKGSAWSWLSHQNRLRFKRRERDIKSWSELSELMWIAWVPDDYCLPQHQNEIPCEVITSDVDGDVVNVLEPEVIDESSLLSDHATGKEVEKFVIVYDEGVSNVVVADVIVHIPYDTVEMIDISCEEGVVDIVSDNDAVEVKETLVVSYCIDISLQVPEQINEIIKSPFKLDDEVVETKISAGAMVIFKQLKGSHAYQDPFLPFCEPYDFIMTRFFGKCCNLYPMMVTELSTSLMVPKVIKHEGVLNYVRPIFLFDPGGDSRTNPFKVGENDVIQEKSIIKSLLTFLKNINIYIL